MAGSALFRQGDECRELTFVGKGSVRVYRTSESGREITLYHVEDGQSCLVKHAVGAAQRARRGHGYC
jgi:CRP/FNR family transcriptional regulator